MKIYQRMTQLLVLSLSVSLLWETPIPAQPSLSAQAPRVQTNQAILPELSKARVIYLGETHDNLADHQAQLQIIQALYQPHRKIAIALEMFQRPFQGVINDYLAGKLNEKELITAIQILDKSRHLLLTSLGAWERLSLSKLSRFSQP
jgi:uncharacterized iron-regulated protein